MAKNEEDGKDEKDGEEGEAGGDTMYSLLRFGTKIESCFPNIFACVCVC